MLDIASQYIHYCLVLLCEVYCVMVVTARDHCCVLCDVTLDLLLGISCTSLIECKSSVKNT